MTTHARIQGIAALFAAKAWKSDAAAQALALAREEPAAIADLARAFFGGATKGALPFVHDVLALMPAADWPGLVRDAVAVLEKDEKNELAADVVNSAALQQPSSLVPHLATLFAMDELYRSYAGIWSFRAAGEAEEVWLGEALRAPNRARKPRARFRSECVDTRMRAFSALLESRRPSAVALAIEAAPSLGLDDAALDAWLVRIELERVHGVLRPLAGPTPLHIAFPFDYIPPPPRHFIAHDLQPTWPTPSPGVALHAIGGVANVKCSLCGEHAHDILTLDPLPDGLIDAGVLANAGREPFITGLARLQLATCLACLGAVAGTLWTQHDDEGRAVSVGGAPFDEPMERIETSGLAPARVALVDLGPRWARQDWAGSNGRENLCRVGGAPTFIQCADYPACDVCRRTCRFLMQLDTVPTTDGDEWLWGSGGLGYAFWCDDCKRSAWTFQCT